MLFRSKDSTTFAMLAIEMCPVELRSLDGKILLAMNKMFDNTKDSNTKYMKNRITREMNSGVNQGFMTSGRQIVWVMLDCFRSADKTDVFYGFDHLSSVTMSGNDLQDYSDRFDRILEMMDPTVRERSNMNTSVLPIYYRNVRNHPELTIIVQIYETATAGTEMRTYDWFRGRVNEILQRNRQRDHLSQRDQQVRAIARPSKHADNAAPAASTVPNGKASASIRAHSFRAS